MWALLVLLCGVLLGVVVERSGFCLFGALAEGFGARSMRRIPSILAAIVVFGLVYLWGFRGNPPCGGIWSGYAGVHSLLGGVIQGIGYVLLACCPLGLLIRVGQASKFHVVAVLGFAAGAALFGQLRTPIVAAMSPLTLEPRQAPKLAAGPESSLSAPVTFSVATVDGGTMVYGPEAGRMRFRYKRPQGAEQTVADPLLLMYTAPPC